MTVLTGRVVQGRVEIGDGVLPEGATVTVLAQPSASSFHLPSSAVEALLESIAEADRGETISGEELLREIGRD
jgi:hypothetical protein